MSLVGGVVGGEVTRSSWSRVPAGPKLDSDLGTSDLEVLCADVPGFSGPDARDTE